MGRNRCLSTNSLEQGGRSSGAGAHPDHSDSSNDQISEKENPMKPQNWKTRSLLFLAALQAAMAWAAPGTISTTLSPISPVTLGSTFTITFTISGYTDATEIDGYNFHVAYP